MTNEEKYWSEYWTDEVEAAVEKYATCEDVTERNEIYIKYLHSAFQKLIDDIIKRYRPDREGREDKDAKFDILSLLVEHVRKYKPELARARGYKTNARVYCSVIIRSAIVDRRVKRYKEWQTVEFNESHEIFLKNII
jgi:hypothetical protein